jgi:integrase
MFFPNRGLSMWTITEQSARSLDPKGKDDLIRFDDKFPGFGVRVRGKNRSYIFQYKIGTRNYRMSCGAVGVVSAKAARETAQGFETALHRGENPALDRRAQRHRDGHTLAAAVEAYLEAMRGKLRPNSILSAQTGLLGHWRKFHGRLLDEITAREIKEHLIKIEERSESAAERARSSLSALYAWARERFMCETNPTVDLGKRRAYQPRERVLDDKELGALWLAASSGGDYHQIIRLVLLTGCRREEIAALKWSEIDLEKRTITIAKERTKNKKTHLVPLVDDALAILQERQRDGEHVFGRGKHGFKGFYLCQCALDQKLQFSEGWTTHDLRRTVSTGLGRLSVQPHIVDAVINHLPAKLHRTYNVYTYDAEKRTALETWQNHIRICIAQATGANVTALRKK